MEPWLTRTARIHGDRVALRTADGVHTTYAELYDRARAVAAALQARRVAPGDHVALALPSAELVVALHACLLLGVVAVPIDLRLTEAEQALRTAHASVILDALPAGSGDGASARGPRGVDPDTTATLMFTSGTTAGPKPVALSYDNWLWNALGSALALGLDPDETWLCPMPLAHVGGLSIQIRSAVYGTTVLLHERFDIERHNGKCSVVDDERHRRVRTAERRDPVGPGDWVLIHVGFAMSKISERDAEEQMRLLTALGEVEQAMEEVRGYGLENNADRAGPIELNGKRYA